MARTIRGLAEAAVESFAVGRDDEARTYLTELLHLCDGHADDAREALVKAEYPRALAVRMSKYTFGRAKQLNRLYAQINSYLPKDQAAALLAEVFAESAAREADINRRSRFYKLACRHAGVDVVARTFSRCHVRVQAPLDGRHPIGVNSSAVVEAPPGWSNS